MAKNDVKGRMNTEPNPEKGRMPAFPSQYFDKDNYSTNVDENNPLPVHDEEATSKLESLKSAIDSQNDKTTKVDGTVDAHIVDGNGETKFTEANTGKVSDKDTQKELQNIKDTQSQIIDALKSTNDTLTNIVKDGAVNTQVTGSLMEQEMIDKNVNVTAGSSVEYEIIGEIGEIALFLRSNSTNKMSSHLVWASPDGYNADVPQTTIKENVRAKDFLTSRTSILSPKFKVKISSDESDVVLSWVFITKFYRKGV